VTAVATHIRLRRAARGDQAAFAALYEKHHQALYRYCRSILHHDEDAQDALQSTMAKAFAALQTDKREIELKPWLFRIAHNEAISILRRRRETTELPDVPELSPLEDRVLDREELRILQLDLADLPERQRAALVLRELNGLSHAEIASVLEITPANVKQTIFEARTSLFACREGREMGCHDVRRMLSDGDGRILRGRGLRAHLRTCPDCRRFQSDLQQRPVALKLLVPPMPTAAAASMLSSLLGGGTAAKLLACVAIAGGGTTLAVEVQQAREAPRAAAATPVPSPTRTPRATGRVVVPAPTPVATTVVAARKTEPKTAKAHVVKKTKKAKKVKKAKQHAKHVQPHPTPKPVVVAPVKRVPPGQANKQARPQPAKKIAKQVRKAIKEIAKASPKLSPGHVKKNASKKPATPPGKLKEPQHR
jgi:RNA polymerase sigma factor (sigma-70 family)